MNRRWQPLRAGLVDLFYYDMEEFHFHDGRLLLRGNNGTGKSKVLALVLPFLLDGELSPHRVEPDGDRNKRMEWNLLLGGRHPHPERLGYTWLEFGRVLADGTTEYRTVGCGLKAVSGRGIAKNWFFVTSQRVGHDLSLVSPTRVALTRERLRDAVEGFGTVYDTATEYRRAIDETFFRLGPRRYEALVNLLIQLRQPQLSKRPDEKLLSKALTEALPPLDPTLVTTVAEAFRGLEEERTALRGLSEAETAASAFLTHYRRYARIAAKRAATPPRLTHSRYEKLNTELTETEAAHRDAETAVAAAEQAGRDIDAERNVLTARRRALQDSPRMRDAELMTQIRTETERLTDFARSRATERATAADTTRRRESALARARSTAEGDEAALDTARRTADASAAAARLIEGHADVMAEFDREPPPFTAAARSGRDTVSRQTSAVDELDRLVEAVSRAEVALSAARAEVDRVAGEQQVAAERIAAAEAAADAASRAVVDACAAYLDRVTRFAVPDPDAVLGALDEWAVAPEGANPFVSAVDDAVSQASADLGRREAGIEAQAREVAARIAENLAETGRLESGGHDVPPVPHTRAPRAPRPGGPLWKVVDFADSVGAAERAGLEAALEATGILDAWVSPDGTLRDAITDDVVVLPGLDAPGGGLTAVLTPAVDRADDHAAALTDDAVRAVLRSIGRGPGAPTWVDTDGRFTIGVLAGSWHKESAEHIGEGARETARRARLATLRAELVDLTSEANRLEQAAEAVGADKTALADERRSMPTDTALREAHLRVATEHQAKHEVDRRLAEANAVAESRGATVTATRAQADEFAGDVGLPPDHDALREIRQAVGDYRVALADLWPAAVAAHRTAQAVHEAADELTAAAERAAEAVAAAEDATAKAEAAAERLRVLVETAGAGIDELYTELAAVDLALGECDGRTETARAQEKVAVEAKGEAAGQRRRLRDEIVTVTEQRDRAIAELRAFAATTVLATALPELAVPDPDTDWPPTPAVVLARTINAELADVDDQDRPWELAQQRVSHEQKTLTDVLSAHGHSAGMTVHNGVMVVDVRFQGRMHDIPSLVAALAAEKEQRAALLSAKEREILENHLVNEVAGTLQELISGAEEQVRDINADLDARPTSTGMRLRLQWRAAREAPDGLERVRKRLLLQTADVWGQEDRALVGGFLQEQINREHTGDSGGSWAEQLTRALDYRAWHEFAIQRHQDGQWRPASGPASGGERVLAASVPLFAAASSFYSSADPDAPRMIALDEAFAGVDDDSRAKCLGLLASFDLDVVMTSEREWGCYPQVPGLAIAQLSRHDGIDAVLVTSWRWDGRERVLLPRPEPAVPTPVAAEPVLFEP